MSDVLTTILTTHGSELARVDDVAYLALAAIYAVADGGAPAFYCVERDWQTMPAARIAALHRANMELVAISERQAVEIKSLTQRLTALESHLATSQDDPGPCPEPGCGRADFKSMAALRMHVQRAHQGMQTPAQSRTTNDQGWHCKARGCTGAFARDLHDLDFCTQHAARTNGVETAA